MVAISSAKTVYETDLFAPIMKNIEDISGQYLTKSARIVADHIRASIFLIADGISPSNTDRGYILRRLIRRAIRHTSLLKINQDFLLTLIKSVIKTYAAFYPNLEEQQNLIFDQLKKEEEKFKKALGAGIREFEKIQGNISAQLAFDLYQNFGFPIELTVELAREKNKKVDILGFENLIKKHQDLSRKASQKTAGGLATQSQRAAKLHSATHLLHQALRDILGNHVHQTGSHITDERLRFDFSHSEKISEANLVKVEQQVNLKIKEDLKIGKKIMPREAAEQIGAIGLFNQKYQDLVNVYYIGKSKDIKDAYSKEFCGGPHATNTRSLKGFKITKEESAGSGIRRIYATIIE